MAPLKSVANHEQLNVWADSLADVRIEYRRIQSISVYSEKLSDPARASLKWYAPMVLTYGIHPACRHADRPHLHQCHTL